MLHSSSSSPSSASAAMVLRAGTSCDATPLRTHSSHPYQYRPRRFLSAFPLFLGGIVDANPVESRPSFHPLVAATASIALGSPRWSSPLVSPSLPHIPRHIDNVTSWTPARPYGWASSSLAASPFVAPRTRVDSIKTQADPHTTSCARATARSPPATPAPSRRQGLLPISPPPHPFPSSRTSVPDDGDLDRSSGTHGGHRRQRSVATAFWYQCATLSSPNSTPTCAKYIPLGKGFMAPYFYKSQ
ncbi:hypothetical protein B0H10DRAFT_2222625 [Mycena sp. CBHHK59/15]|nr:hypothetical protein B0H10DRAFT_2222625 [Mycena sp. CBHHK59/15]